MCTTATREARRGGFVLLAAVVAVFGVACGRASAKREARAALPLAEVQITSLPNAIATKPVPALPGQPVPSRYCEPTRPIGWEMMLAERVDEIDHAGGDPRTWSWWSATTQPIGGGPTTR